MKELKPAHEVIAEKVVRHSRNLKAISEMDSNPEFTMEYTQNIGGLCSQVETLTSVVIPEEKIPWVVERLIEANHLHFHCVTSGAIEELARRAPDK